MKKFLRLKEYFYKYRWSIVSGFGFLLLTNITSLAAPWVLKLAIDSLKSSLSLTPKTLLFYASLLVGVTIVQGAFRFFTRLILIGISRRIEYDFRNEILSHLQKLPWSFFTENKTGDIMTRTTEDLNAVRMALGPGFMHFFNTLVLFLAAGGLLFYINPRLAFFALLPLPLLSFMIRTLSRRIYQHFRGIQQQLADISTRVQENFAGIRIIKAYLQEEAELQAINKLGKEYVQKNLRLARIWGLFLPLMMLTSGLGAVIVLWLGGRQVIQGTLSLGEFVAFNSYLAMLIFPMMAMGWVINLFQRGAASMDRIVYILDEPPQEDIEIAPAHVIDTNIFQGQLEFRNLSFSYGKSTENRWTLKDINLVIPAGTTLGIVGPVGAGKSTLANLIPRLLEVTQGELLLDGVEISKLPLKELRKLVGYVPQESFLFSTSLKENILYGLDNLPAGLNVNEMERILHVSRIAELLQEAESFPEKFDTKLGERGVTLSGGQRQRTALARALVMEPKILILDDAFASVDTYTEGKILQHLKPFMTKRTCIIISHRISTLKDANQIIVLQEGQITEQGTHEELIQNNGFYTQIYHKQLLLDKLGTSRPLKGIIPNQF